MNSGQAGLRQLLLIRAIRSDRRLSFLPRITLMNRRINEYGRDPDSVLGIDRYFAAGGFMMAAALAARRKGKAVDRRRRFRWFGRA